MGHDRPRVVASILTWNEYEDTRRCLTSLRSIDYDNLDIVLVDNNSTDGSIDRLATEFPDITIIRNDRNLGYAKAQNRAIEHALEHGAEYVWLLNNDVAVPGGCLKELVTQAEVDPTKGVITPVVRDGGQTWFSYGRVNRLTGYTNTGPLARFLRSITNRDTESRFIETDYVPLCCTLIRADVFRDLGLLPDVYFIYTEDVEFCLRAADHGYRVVTDTHLTVDHAASSSGGGAQNPLTNYYLARNQWILRDRLESIRWYLFVPSHLFWLWKRTFLAMFKKRPRGAKALLEGSWDGVRRHTGKGRYP